MLFDTHAHYDDKRFDEDRHEVIKRVYDSGVSYILNASSNVASSIESISLSRHYDFIYAAVGIHPHDAVEGNDNSITKLADFAAIDKVVAIGEIGLDYHYNFSPRELQKHWFTRQIDLAKNLGLPIVVHNREAHWDVMEIIKKEDAKKVGGVFHCYSGSVEMARELLNLNFYISIGGPITFKNARRTVEVVKYIPCDRLLIETDCPYLAPEPYRGKRNDSSYIKLIAEKIAEIKGIALEKIVETTSNNAKLLFQIE